MTVTVWLRCDVRQSKPWFTGKIKVSVSGANLRAGLGETSRRVTVAIRYPATFDLLFMHKSQVSSEAINNLLVPQAATQLAQRRLRGEVGPLLEDALRPLSLAAAFTLQQQVMIAMNEPVAGWKCLLPTAEKIVVAPIFASSFYQMDDHQTRPGTCAMWPSMVPASAGLARVEPELAFVLKQALPPKAEPYSDAEIDSAIGATHLALELIQSRFSHDSGAGFFDQLADGLFNQGLFLGPEIQAQDGVIADKFDLLLRFADGREQHIAAVHPNQQPRAGLYWLVNFLSANHICLHAGQAVITGSYAGVLDLPFGELIQFQYGDLGQFSVQFVAR
jgi:2-keto-4-pentenoate hydratase